MKSHDLAKKLLELKNVNVGVVANGHVYSSFKNQMSHGNLRAAFISERQYSNHLQEFTEPEETLLIGNLCVRTVPEEYIFHLEPPGTCCYCPSYEHKSWDCPLKDIDLTDRFKGV